MQSIRNGLVAEGDPLHPICSTTVGSGGTQQNTCCRCCFCHSAGRRDELAVICDPSLKLHPGHFLQTVTPADTGEFHRVIFEWFGVWTVWWKVTKHTMSFTLHCCRQQLHQNCIIAIVSLLLKGSSSSSCFLSNAN